MVKLPHTLDDTIGPYFPACYVDKGHLDMRQPYPSLVVSAKGQPIRVRVRMLDVNGGLASGCSLIDVWQADASGAMRRPGNQSSESSDAFFSGFGRVVSVDGTFSFDSVKPGSSVSGGASRAPNITLNFFCDGFNRLVTQFFFADESDSNIHDPLLQSLPEPLRDRLLARRIDDEDGVACYQFDVVFRGEFETPFFDDILS
ncbi:dioxygenase family protein [Pseudomonas azerbaijanoccidentalis]|jgi:protocatechuate 3,4-dioxygenase beta subunit